MLPLSPARAKIQWANDDPEPIERAGWKAADPGKTQEFAWNLYVPEEEEEKHECCCRSTTFSSAYICRGIQLMGYADTDRGFCQVVNWFSGPKSQSTDNIGSGLECLSSLTERCAGAGGGAV